MAVSWGDWEYSGGNGMRVGIEVTASAVNTNSSTVTFTIDIWTDNQYSYNDSQVLNYGGSISGSTSFTNNDSTTAQKRATLTHTYTYSTYGSSPGTRTFTATISGAYNGVTPTKSYTATIPARPYAAPNAPSGISATRNSDSQITVGWTRNVTSQKPYTSQTLATRYYTGTGWTAWTYTTLSATATSYAATGLVSNRVYEFAVRGNNSIGSSAYVYSSAVAMTPASPSSVSASVDPSGTSITVTWVPANYSGTYQPTFTIERSVNGAAYTTLFTGQTGTSKVDPSPGAGTNKYRVKAVYASLSFTGTESNTVSTIVAPLAPTLLAPTGLLVDMVGEATVLTWQHNHGGDGAAQTAYQVQFSNNGGSTWTALDTGTVVSANSTHTVNAGVLANGVVYQWRVRTRGITTPGFGPYSAVATLTATSRPTLTIGNPPATTVALPITVGWTYSQAQSSPQSNWKATLKDAGGSIVEEKSGAGTTASTTFSAPVEDGATYTVEVQVQSTVGMWSAVVTDTTTVSLLPPANVTIVAMYDPCSGSVVLDMAADAPVGGVTVAVDTVIVERRVPGGEWVRIAQDLEMPLTIIDPIPATVGTNEYRATATSASPSYAVMTPVAVTATNDDEHWAFVSYGPGFTSTLRLRSALSTSATSGRARSVEAFAGRRLPTLLIGEQRTRVVSVAGTAWFDGRCGDPGECAYDSSRDEWEEASWEAGVVCYRDWTGRRLFGMLGDMATADLSPGIATVGFSVTQTEYDEPPGYALPEIIPG
jgi:hypothetical protein